MATPRVSGGRNYCMEPQRSDRIHETLKVLLVQERFELSAVKLYSLAAGAELPAAAIPYQQARFVLDGGVESSGEEYPGISFAYIPPDEKFGATRAYIETTMLVITWSYSGGPTISSALSV